MAVSDYKELWIVLALIVGLGILWFVLGGPQNSNLDSPFLTGSRNASSTANQKEENEKNSEGEASQNYEPVTKGGLEIEQQFNPPILQPYLPKRVTGVGGQAYQASPWYQKFTLNKGTASSATDEDEEYITIKAGSDIEKPVSITGWILENGRDRVLVESGSGVRPGSVSSARIGTGVAIFLNQSNQQTHAITLSAGDQAIVTTGAQPRISGLANLNTNFRLNKCMGYLAEDLSQADRGFFSFFRATCPKPSEEEGVGVLPDACYNFVRNLKSCTAPTSRQMREADLSNFCKEYVRDHFSYGACIANHAFDTDFLRGEWRIYLNRSKQLWDDSREVITLYDSSGRLVTQIAY